MRKDFCVWKLWHWYYNTRIYLRRIKMRKNLRINELEDELEVNKIDKNQPEWNVSENTRTREEKKMKKSENNLQNKKWGSLQK